MAQIYEIITAPWNKHIKSAQPKSNKYPWDKMKVPHATEDGKMLYDYFFVPVKASEEIKNVRTSASIAGKKLGAKFSVRQEVKDGEPGVIVVRIK